jgi:hypothetical protein
MQADKNASGCVEKISILCCTNKKICSESDADCVVRVLRSSIFCCTKTKLFCSESNADCVVRGFTHKFYLTCWNNSPMLFLKEPPNPPPQDLTHIWLCQAQGYHMQIRSLKVLCQGVDWQSKSMYT